jgi:small subunit ribosomal protein S6
MKEYELLYIVPAQYTDIEISKIQEKIHQLLESTGAKVLRDENLGKVRLAYPIKTQRHGSYILAHFNAEPSVIQDLNRRLTLTEEILRHTLLVRAKGALEKKFELLSYVAPLSEEARAEREPSSRRSARPITRRPIPQIASPTPAVAQVPAMSMEELDEKLDKILEGDIAENI